MSNLRSNPSLLRNLQYFETVARLQSVTAAAKVFGVSPSAVSHQLNQLAERLGEQLVTRQGRGIALTDAGRRVAERLSETFSGIDSLLDDVMGGGRMSMTVGVCSSFGPSWLIPRLPNFMAEHPMISLETRMYHQDPEQTFLTADAIVTAGQVKPGYSSVNLFDEHLVAVILSSALTRAPLGPHRLITTDPQREVLGQDWVNYCRRTGRDLALLKAGDWIRCSHYVLAIELARSGLGIALVPDFLAALHVENGSLAYFDRTHVSARRTYRLCHKSTRKNDSAMRIFSRWLKAQAVQFETSDVHGRLSKPQGGLLQTITAASTVPKPKGKASPDM